MKLRLSGAWEPLLWFESSLPTAISMPQAHQDWGSHVATDGAHTRSDVLTLRTISVGFPVAVVMDKCMVVSSGECYAPLINFNPAGLMSSRRQSREVLVESIRLVSQSHGNSFTSSTSYPSRHL